MTGWKRDDEEAGSRLRRAAVDTAHAILREEIGVIDGARRLSSLAHRLVDDWRVDPDFLVFGALDTETDHLPVGAQRALWDPAALVDKDAMVARIEAVARADVEMACRNVIARFGDVPRPLT